MPDIVPRETSVSKQLETLRVSVPFTKVHVEDEQMMYMIDKHGKEAAKEIEEKITELKLDLEVLALTEGLGMAFIFVKKKTIK